MTFDPQNLANLPPICAKFGDARTEPSQISLSEERPGRTHGCLTTDHMTKTRPEDKSDVLCGRSLQPGRGRVTWAFPGRSRTDRIGGRRPGPSGSPGSNPQDCPEAQARTGIQSMALP